MNQKLTIVCFLALTALIACQEQKSSISTDEFLLKEGFKIALIAAEPLLDSPIAMEEDAEGKLWVVEMPGYMRDINASEEAKPDGKIIILEDTDKDGTMDKRTVFLDNLVMPRAISLVYGGLLYTDAPKLWWTAIKDGQPHGTPVLVDSLYVVGGNIEHQPNGLLYNLDNWIYSAKSQVRYQRKNGKWIKEVVGHRGQWGIGADDEGRLFYNSNSIPIEVDFNTPKQLRENPFFKPKKTYNNRLDANRRVYPYQATAVNRGYNKGVLDSLGMLNQFTSACGPVVYRGDQFPADFQGNAFVCAPEVNLIKRYLISEENGRLIGKQAYADSEFLISKEESFRPINLYNSLDGAMYIVDLRKGIIQHRAYMSNYLRELILERGLDKITGIGRIYKITTTHPSNESKIDFSQFTATATDFVKLLQHPSGQLRSFAQKQLIFGNHEAATATIKKIALDTTSQYGQIHALWTLEGLGKLDIDLLIKVSEKSSSPIVFKQVLQLAKLFKKDEPKLLPVFEKAIALNAPKVDLQLANTLGHFAIGKSRTYLGTLADKYADEPIFVDAMISGLAGMEPVFLKEMNSKYPNSKLVSSLKETIENQKNNDLQLPTVPTKEYLDSRTLGAKNYEMYCATCHGIDGKAADGLAPPLYESEYIKESAEKLILISLNGMQGPVTVKGKLYDTGAIMPGVRHNPALNDKDLAALLRFIVNGLASSGPRISESLVKKLRAQTANQEELFTEESLETWLEEYKKLEEE